MNFDKLTKKKALLDQHRPSAPESLRYWTKEGLLEVADMTEANYQLYAPEMVYTVAGIRDWGQNGSNVEF